MFNPNHLSDIFSNEINIYNGKPVGFPEGILLADKTTLFEKKYAYVISDKDFSEHSIHGANPLVLFVSLSDPDIRLNLTREYPVITVKSSVGQILNSLSIKRAQWVDFRHSLEIAKKNGIRDVLSVLSQKIRASVFLLNQDLALVEKCEVKKSDDLALTLLTSGRPQPQEAANHFANDSSDITMGNSIMIRIPEDGPVMGHLLIAGHSPQHETGAFIDIVIDTLKEMMLHDSYEKISKNNSTRMSEFLSKLRGEYASCPEKIAEGLSGLDIPQKKESWFLFVIVKSCKPSGFDNSALEKLHSFFINHNQCYYDGVFTVLISKRAMHEVEDLYNAEQFEALLDEIDAVALKSHNVQRELGIRTSYILTRETVEIVPKIRLDYDPRCCGIERYTIYCMLNLYAPHIKEDLAHERLIYFAYPQIISLSMYDQEHKTDLRDVLYYYIVSDCNVNKTAEMMHMHRNTVFNKLKKIKELVGISLDKPSEKSSILFSCQLIRYIENVQHTNIAYVNSAMPIEEK